MTACKLCTGSRYLGGVEAMGRCICVTPAAMLALEAELDQTTAENEERYGEMTDEALRYLRARIDRYVNQHPEAGDPSEVTWGDAEAALRDYLASTPHGAHPIGTTGNLALDRLIDVIF